MSIKSGVAGVLDSVLDRTIVPGYSRLGYAVRSMRWDDDPGPSALAGKTVVVTGAGAGLGLAAARGAARLGAVVVVVVRNLQKGENARDAICRAVPSADVRVEICDVANLADVRTLGARLCERVERIDVLVHNAGVMPPSREETVEGHELTLATHVLGPMRLTESVLPALAAADDPRVILVSSGGMYAQSLVTDDIDYRASEYKPATAYARTKRMQVALTPQLNRRWAAHGISTYCMHPGWADTPGVAESLPTFRRITEPLLRTPDQGADTILWLAATEPAPPGGTFWHDRRPRPTHYVRRTRESSGELETLWQYCCAATGITQ